MSLRLGTETMSDYEDWSGTDTTSDGEECRGNAQHHPDVLLEGEYVTISIFLLLLIFVFI